MKKNIFLSFLALILIFCVSVLMANVDISKKHKDMKKDNKAVNCVFCHGAGGAGIEKKKQAPDKMAQIKKQKWCTGQGCHQ